MNAVRAVIRFLWDLIYFLTREGSWSLRPHERVVIEAAIAHLPAQSKMLLRAQLGGSMFIQRSHQQISRPRFYGPGYKLDQRMLEIPECSEKTIEVKLDVGGVHEVAQVVFWQGRVDSIQFRWPAAHYEGKLLKVIDTRLGKLARSHAAAIDRREHGRER